MSALRKGLCPGVLRPMEAKDGLLVRLRPSGGILSAKTADAVADLAERHGNGFFDLTARANLQMRGVRAAALPSLQDGLQALGLVDANAGAEAVRNVIASPLAGLHGGPNIRPLVAALERRLTEDPTLHALPGKFGFLIDDGSRPSLASVDADVRFDWDGARFEIGLGGPAGQVVSIARCDASGLVDEAARIAKVFLALAETISGARRMRDLIAALGDEGIDQLATTHPTGVSNPRTRRRRDDCFRERGTDSARTTVGRQTEAVNYLGLAAPFGRLDAAMLRSAARLAAQTAYGELRLTPFRVLIVPGATETAEPCGFITDPADPRLAVAACVGAAGCARGTTDTHADASNLAAALAPSDEIALHVSGCEKGCAKASTTAITLIARDGRYDLVRNGRAGNTPLRHGLDLAAARRALVTELEPA